MMGYFNHGRVLTRQSLLLYLTNVLFHEPSSQRRMKIQSLDSQFETNRWGRTFPLVFEGHMFQAHTHILSGASHITQGFLYVSVYVQSSRLTPSQFSFYSSCPKNQPMAAPWLYWATSSLKLSWSITLYLGLVLSVDIIFHIGYNIYYHATS